MIASKFVVLAKVRHSQRMNEALIPIWIITEKDGTINCAHCLGCKAGLAESCSHIASVHFYLEAWTKVNGRLACTQMKSRLCSKENFGEPFGLPSISAGVPSPPSWSPDLIN